MNFDQMRAVVEVARLRSFSRAGETLGLTQPAISAQVRQIEEEVGYRLFDRLGRNVHLTQPGIVLLEHAARMLDLRRQAIQAVADLRRPSARLNIGATESICLYVLPPVAARISVALSGRSHQHLPACDRPDRPQVG